MAYSWGRGAMAIGRSPTEHATASLKTRDMSVGLSAKKEWWLRGWDGLKKLLSGRGLCESCIEQDAWGGLSLGAKLWRRWAAWGSTTISIIAVDMIAVGKVIMVAIPEAIRETVGWAWGVSVC